VGCVLVKNGEVVGEGWHKRAGGPHAEILALQQAGNSASGATAYVTLEPCSHTGKTPPCADALIKAGVSKVIAAMVDPNSLVAGKGLEMLRESGIDVESGLLEEQARALNPGFIKRMETGLPFVRVKMAMSLDGRTAMASGESQWITGEAARRDVQLLRARSSAVLTGIGTVLSDDPSMNVRLTAEQLGIDGDIRQPIRVVVDSHMRFPSDAKLCKLDGDVLILTAADTLNDVAGGEVVKTQAAEDRVDLDAAMSLLAKRQVNEVHVEAGATLNGALLKKRLVDEVVIYMAPCLMGDEARGLFSLAGLSEMKDRVHLDIQDVRAIGKDLRITARPVYA
jgi:diaminohydroxyphosphoribosylaminopyrimidine deaminase/5-amino-6-(5-phosphoribosylamino)uracil reductase